MPRRRAGVAPMVLWAVAAALPTERLFAHHSFAMYDRSIRYVFTGVVESINPDPSHLQIVFVPLNDAREALVRDAGGQRVSWSVEMEGAAASARGGVSSSNFPRGTVFSVGLTTLPWPRIWEEYFEQGMSRPAEDDSLGGLR